MPVDAAQLLDEGVADGMWGRNFAVPCKSGDIQIFMLEKIKNIRKSNSKLAVAEFKAKLVLKSGGR